MTEQWQQSSSIYSPYPDNSLDQTPIRAVRYKPPHTPRVQSSNVSFAPNPEVRQSTPKTQKANRYIKFLKDQNVMLKQQMDQIQQDPSIDSTKSSISSARNLNPTVEQIRYDQLLLDYQTLQRQVEKSKSESENQQADKLSQIESLLREKEQFLEEKDRLQSEILRLSKQIEEAKKQTQKKAENDFADREQQLKNEMQKIKSDSKKIKAENDQYLSEIDEIKAKINEIKEKSCEIQNQCDNMKVQNEKLKNDNELLKNKNLQLIIENGGLKQESRKTNTTNDQKDVAALNSTSRNRKSNPDDAKADKYKSKLKDLKLEKENYHNLNTKLNEQLKQQLDTISNLKTQIYDLQCKNDSLSNQRSEALTLYEKVTNEVSDLRNKATDLQIELDAKNEDFMKMSEKKGGSKKLKKKITSLKQENVHLVTKNKDLERKIKILESAPSKVQLPPQSALNQSTPPNTSASLTINNSSTGADRTNTTNLNNNNISSPQNNSMPPLNLGKVAPAPINDAAIAFLAEKIDHLASKVNEDNEKKAKQIEKLSSSIVSLSETHQSLSHQVQELKTQYNKSSIEALDDFDFDSPNGTFGSEESEEEDDDDDDDDI